MAMVEGSVSDAVSGEQPNSAGDGRSSYRDSQKVRRYDYVRKILTYCWTNRCLGAI